MSKQDDHLQAVQARFDALAPHYDETLQRAKCFAGELILDAFRRHPPAQAPDRLHILDLGCGTGQCGKVFRPHAERLDGVDLSQKMLDEARALNVYDHLYQGDLLAHLQHSTQRYHLITIASVFLYFPRLEETLEACRSMLHPGGILIFTVDRLEQPGLDVAPNPRNPLMYLHARGYVERCLAQTGLTVVAVEEIDERLAWKDLTPVPALLAVSARDGR